MRVIAEIGSCWTTFEQAKDSIQLAKVCGADAVKFQLFDFKSLYGFDGANLPEQITGPVTKSAMPKEWIPLLAEKAKGVGIDFMCTAFSPELVKLVDPYVTTHKVASAELTHVRLLEEIAKTKKSVMLSTGASGMYDIQQALNILEPCKVTIMYCVSSYPARVINFDCLDILRKSFGTKYSYGFSDHSTDATIIPVVAKQRGAEVIEKHVNFFGVSCPDAPHSLTREEFKYMCMAIRGQPVPIGANGDPDMFVRANRRILAIADIQPGEKFKENVNVGVVRSIKPDTQAISPWLINDICVRTAKRAIKAGDPIIPDDLK